MKTSRFISKKKSTLTNLTKKTSTIRANSASFLDLKIPNHAEKEMHALSFTKKLSKPTTLIDHVLTLSPALRTPANTETDVYTGTRINQKKNTTQLKHSSPPSNHSYTFSSSSNQNIKK